MSVVRTCLLALQLHLNRRYAGLRVKAYVQEYPDEAPFRTLEFHGSRAALLAYGLATEPAKGKLEYADGLGTTGGGAVFDNDQAYMYHHLLIEGETARPRLPRKFPTKRLQADVRRICIRLATANE